MHANWDVQDSKQKCLKKGHFQKDGGNLHAMISLLVSKELKQAILALSKCKLDASDLHTINESVNMFTHMDINNDTLKQLKDEMSDSDEE